MRVVDSGRRGFLKNGVTAVLGAAAMPLSRPTFGWAADMMQETASASAPAAARIKIDFERKLGTIERNIYGNFIEHLGRCIYDGIYDEGSKLSDSDGFRKDVLEAARGIHVPLLRWPGGNFSSGYNWKDGVGPKDARPRRWDTAWQEEESNHFGTDDFIEYCRKLGAEPYITVNMGTGTMQDAADWVEYCNATTDTAWANLRKKNGHAEPYNVKYWGLGNEIYGSWQAGHKDAAGYAADALEFAKMMRWVDPSIKLVACGGPGVDWNMTVLEHTAYIVDYISLHHYGGTLDTAKEFADASAMEKQIGVLDAIITAAMARTQKKERVGIAVDEWNIWFRSWFHRGNNHMLEEIYNLRDALWVASGLNTFQRMCRTVKLADMAQLVNVIAPIMSNDKGIVLQTTYYPLKLYTEHCGDVALDALVRSDTFPELPDTPYLDVSATTDNANQKLTLAVVNRHPTAEISADIAIEGFKPQSSGEIFEINGPSLDATNTFDSPNQVTAKRRTLSGAGQTFRQTFAAHSVTLVVMQA
ncbi:MAG TPA: alpha-L-arabinofuranosidase C-terminal domain-containing protein [Candidatus Acidoferrales bacterium]|nr:alpha-L-arabinofuranosidase C-terminal domain-containing protein [Candidatus Acidoferrales bacterium]